MLDKRKFYINGNWVNPSKPNDFKVINPSNEEPFATISLGFKEDIDVAVKSWEKICTIKSFFDLAYRIPSLMV